MDFFRQECWSGLPFPSPGDLPNPGTEPTSLMSPALAGVFFIPETLGKLLLEEGIYIILKFKLFPNFTRTPLKKASTSDPVTICWLKTSVEFGSPHLSSQLQINQFMIKLVLQHWGEEFYFVCATWLVGSYCPAQKLNPGPQQWKCQVLTTGAPGTSQEEYF